MNAKIGIALFTIFALAAFFLAMIAEDYIQRQRHGQIIEMMSGIEQRTKLIEEIIKP